MRRPLWQASLVNLIAQAMLAAFPAMLFRDALLAHYYEGSFKEIGWVYVTPRPLSLAWFGDLTIACGWAFLCMIPGTLLFAAVARRLERSDVPMPLEWAITGAATATPLAIGSCILVANSIHFPAEVMPYVIAAAVTCTIGAVGGILAWHVRYHRRHHWAEPL